MMEAIETINTLSKNKKITRIVLIILLVILVLMVSYGILFRNDFLLFYLGLIYLFFSLEYLRSFFLAYQTVSFRDDYIVLAKKEKSLILLYTDIICLKEIRNNFIEILTLNDKKILIHGEFSPKMQYEDNKRTVNIVSRQTKKRSSHIFEIKYK